MHSTSSKSIATTTHFSNSKRFFLSTESTNRFAIDNKHIHSMPKLKITEPGRKPKTYNIKITRETISIGRKDNNDLQIIDASISSQHCNIRRVEGGYVLDDLNSTNGSKIDGKRYYAIDLDDDCHFKLGDVPIDFSLDDDECAILDEEDEFEPQQKEKKKPKRGGKSSNRDESSESKDDSEQLDDEDYDDDEDEDAGSSGFLFIVAAFLLTIIIALIALFLTGNL